MNAKKEAVAKEAPKQPDQLLRDFLTKERLTLTPSPMFTPTNHGTFEVKIDIGVRRK